MVVLKKGGKWHVCVDYTELNEACPKDSFLLPCIDQIVDAIAGHGILSFCHFWMPSLDTIRFLCIRLTWRKQPSLHSTDCTAIT